MALALRGEGGNGKKKKNKEKKNFFLVVIVVSHRGNLELNQKKNLQHSAKRYD